MLDGTALDIRLANHDFIQCLNQLIIQLSVLNGHRTGVLVNMKIGDLALIFDNGNCVILIREHKMAKPGPDSVDHEKTLKRMNGAEVSASG